MGWQTIVVTACIEIDLLEILPHHVFICCVQQSSGFGIKEIEKLVPSVSQINRQDLFLVTCLEINVVSKRLQEQRLTGNQ